MMECRDRGELGTAVDISGSLSIGREMCRLFGADEMAGWLSL
jgi:hypothetical protein